MNNKPVKTAVFAVSADELDCQRSALAAVAAEEALLRSESRHRETFSTSYDERVDGAFVYSLFGRLKTLDKDAALNGFLSRIERSWATG